LLYRYFLKSGVIFYEDEVWSQMMREGLGVSAKRFSSLWQYLYSLNKTR